ncbi:Sigma-54, DNA binding domain protein [Ostertagia ostertagi]
MQLLDGAAVSAHIKEQIRLETLALQTTTGCRFPVFKQEIEEMIFFLGDHIIGTDLTRGSQQQIKVCVLNTKSLGNRRVGYTAFIKIDPMPDACLVLYQPFYTTTVSALLQDGHQHITNGPGGCPGYPRCYIRHTVVDHIVDFKDGAFMRSQFRCLEAATPDMVNNEDKQNPLSDDRLKELLQEKGFNLARRTIAKYREQTNIPVARLRRQV